MILSSNGVVKQAKLRGKRQQAPNEEPRKAERHRRK